MNDSILPAHALTEPGLAAVIVNHALAYAIFTMDFEGRILSWSPGAEAVLGYTAEMALGMDFSALFTESDRAAQSDRLELEKVRTTGRAEDSRWHLRQDGSRFWANGVAMRLDGPEVVGVMKILRDETAFKVAEEKRILLLNELNHRIKNTLATVQAIAEQTLRSAQVDRETRENLTGRLMALSEAHNVLVSENWAGADLREIVAQALAPYRSADRRLDIDGPDVRLSPPQAVTMALALHELATNAVKYGALSVPEGSVEVRWNASYDATGARHMTFLWAERGGPVVTPPTRTGFGSRLLARNFGEDSGGQARMMFEPTGLRCAIEIPLSVPGELEILDIANAP
jgi:PAS domain S-box-containing protein